ncbi:MAG: hypothetical protein ACJA0U_002262 [Salibacteraceae bacterium]|jgi:hypothetical protein
MKKLSILFVSISIMMLPTKCSSPSADQLCTNSETRGQIISELVNNDNYMNQVMDSMMQNNHGMEMMTGNNPMMNSKMSGKGMMDRMRSDTSMQRLMMNNMMYMLENDSVFCANVGNRIMKNENMKNKMMQQEETDRSDHGMMNY